jgi:hypothetical protein
MNGWTNTSSKASSLTAIAANRLPANGMLKITPRNGYLRATLTAIANKHPKSRIDDLMPWAFQKTSS